MYSSPIPPTGAGTSPSRTTRLSPSQGRPIGTGTDSSGGTRGTSWKLDAMVASVGP